MAASATLLSVEPASLKPCSQQHFIVEGKTSTRHAYIEIYSYMEWTKCVKFYISHKERKFEFLSK